MNVKNSKNPCHIKQRIKHGTLTMKKLHIVSQNVYRLI